MATMTGKATESDGRPAVWDADAHICEPTTVWTEYAEPAFRDRVLQVRARADGTEAFFVGGREQGPSPAGACIPGRYGDPAVRWSDILPGSWDPAARLAVLDEEGIDHAVMFPSLWLLSGDLADPAVAVASARAYNRWMADFVATDPARLFGVGVCPLQAVDEAVAEIGRMAASGLSALTFRPERYDGLELYSEEMDRVWAAAADANLTVAIHGSFGSRMPSFARTRYTNQFFVHMVCHPFEQMAAVMEIVASGVLDRHPGLRVGFLESGLGWLPYWLERLDEHRATLGSLMPALKRDPTEIWSEQCFVTMEADEGEAFAQLAGMGLAHTVVWGSDYPHYDCTYPGALAALDATFAALGREDQRDAVLGANARRFLGLG